MIKALWHTGQEVVRGAGCLGGFCGACATYYRTKDDPKVRTCLACQMAVEDGMSFTIMPPFPAAKRFTTFSRLKIPSKTSLICTPSRRSAETVTQLQWKPAPRKLMSVKASGKQYLATSKRVRNVHGLCHVRHVHAVCIADIAPNLVALYVSRAQGAHFTESPRALISALKKFKTADSTTSGNKVLAMNEQELADHCATVK